MIGDILLKIDNDPLDSDKYAKLDQMRQDIVSGKKPYADLFILRDKKVICYRVVKGNKWKIPRQSFNTEGNKIGIHY